MTTIDSLAALYAEVDRRNIQYSGPFYAQVSETRPGFAVWHDESGDQVCEADSLDDAIAKAHQMNAEHLAKYGADDAE